MTKNRLVPFNAILGRNNDYQINLQTLDTDYDFMSPKKLKKKDLNNESRVSLINKDLKSGGFNSSRSFST